VRGSDWVVVHAVLAEMNKKFQLEVLPNIKKYKNNFIAA
jgi:hypothetical protein